MVESKGLAMSLFAACLPDNDLNSKIKDLLLESLRKKPNPKGIEKVLGKIQALEADFNAKQVTKKRRVASEDKHPVKDIDCRICEKNLASEDMDGPFLSRARSLDHMV